MSTPFTPRLLQDGSARHQAERGKPCGSSQRISRQGGPAPAIDAGTPQEFPAPDLASELDHRSAAQRLGGLAVAVAVEIGVPLTQQLLGAGIGADLLAAVAPPAWGGAIGDHSACPTTAEVPRGRDASLQLPHPIAASAGPILGIEVLLGVAAAEVAAIGVAAGPRSG